MNDHMTVPEIKAAFPSEWVLLADPQKDEQNRVVSGSVLCHSKDRDVVHGQAIAVECKHIAILYTGPVPAPGKAILI